MELTKEERIIVRYIMIEALSLVKEFQKLTEFEFGYDIKSVEWVDNYIGELREQEHFNREIEDEMTEKIGSYLGECIRKEYDGQWIKDDDNWGVEMNDKLIVFPFVKTKKRFNNGREDSIASFFTMVPHVTQIVS